MENRLEPLSDYVLNNLTSDANHSCYLIQKYTKFLKQNLSERYEVNGVSAHPLNRFVPCDLYGNVLEAPMTIYYKPDFGVQKHPIELYEYDLEQYQQAKGRVLFEGFKYKVADWCDEYVIELSFNDCDLNFELIGSESEILCAHDEIRINTIENLVKHNFTLTKTGAELCGKTK